jgi:hypothetical protein
MIRRTFTKIKKLNTATAQVWRESTQVPPHEVAESEETESMANLRDSEWYSNQLSSGERYDLLEKEP